WWPRLLRTAGVGHDAIGAELVAPDHDPHVGLPGAGPHLRIAQRVVALERAGHLVAPALCAAQRDGERLLASPPDFVDQPRDLRQLPGADDQIDMRRPPEDL